MAEPGGPLRLAFAQHGFAVGDLPANAARLLAARRRAAEGGAELAVTGELGLTGYPPEDLLLRGEFIAATAAAARRNRRGHR